MNRLQRHDVVVIGSGSAGFSAAVAARQAGASVCVVESGALGGECPNDACLPSKALLRCAKALRAMERAREYGVSCQKPSHDFSAMQDYRRAAIEAVTGKDGERYLGIMERLGIDLVRGEAVFADAETLEVGEAVLRAKAFVVATGSEDVVPAIPGLSDMTFLGWREAIRLERQPKSIAIVGGGPVGVELATFFSALGTRVLLFQRSATVLSREDSEIARLAQDRLKALGVEVFAHATVHEAINARGGIYGLKAESDGKTEVHAVEEVVLAVGKRPRVSGLRLEAAGIRASEGQVKTDARGRSNIGQVFFAGDADGGLMFTHTAHHEGSIAGHNAALVARGARRGWKTRDERSVPRVTFLDPEVASVGMTQEEAVKRFGKVLVGRCRVGTLGRAVADGDREGLLKIVAHHKTRKVLGAHAVCARAGEVIHEAALAIHLNASVDKVASMIHAYPTYSEALAVAAGSLQTES